MAKDVLSQWINPAYNSPASLAGRYRGAKPFPYISLTGFLQEDKAEALAEALSSQSFERKESDLFLLHQTKDLTHAEDKTIKAFSEFLRSKEFSAYMKAITGVRLTNASLDLAGALYTDTNYLLCHDDQLTGRKIAFILYLCPQFAEKDGGALALRSDKKGSPGPVVKRLYPTWNTLNFFTVSKESWHEVEEVLADKPRLSIGGWLH